MILEIIGFLIIGLSLISPFAAITSLAILGATLVLYGMGNKIISALNQNQPG